MRRKTYNNVMKAAKLIMKKGYGERESYDMALGIFDRNDTSVHTAEWYIDKMMTKEEYESEYGKDR